jgi:hypothetical protein
MAPTMTDPGEPSRAARRYHVAPDTGGGSVKREKG